MSDCGWNSSRSFAIIAKSFPCVALQSPISSPNLISPNPQSEIPNWKYHPLGFGLVVYYKHVWLIFREHFRKSTTDWEKWYVKSKRSPLNCLIYIANIEYIFDSKQTVKKIIMKPYRTRFSGGLHYCPDLSIFCCVHVVLWWCGCSSSLPVVAHPTAAALVLARGVEAAAGFQPNACPATIFGTKVIEPGRTGKRGTILVRRPVGRIRP